MASAHAQARPDGGTREHEGATSVDLAVLLWRGGLPLAGLAMLPLAGLALSLAGLSLPLAGLALALAGCWLAPLPVAPKRLFASAKRWSRSAYDGLTHERGLRQQVAWKSSA